MTLTSTGHRMHHTARTGELVAGPVTVEVIDGMSHLHRHEPVERTVQTDTQQAKPEGSA